ncbi:MAG: hypothetical protein KME20_28780 [Kaiparowitsia implicata GSE-PSE-MK54-09C]|nr:hypothetical protein [Kaiparowitsia implicata GSE-PSE-MK54-09C]
MLAVTIVLTILGAYFAGEYLFAAWPQFKVVLYSMTVWGIVVAIFSKNPRSRS